jgi:hypothetical protein
VLVYVQWAADTKEEQRKKEEQRRLGEGGREEGTYTIGDPHLVSIDHPAVPLLLSTALGTSDVRAGLRLSDTICSL